MELDDLKSNWNSSNEEQKSTDQLQLMTKIKHHPSFKNIRKRLVVELMGLLAFASLYWTAFDGSQKPLIANVILLIGLIAYALNHIITLWLLPKPFTGTSIKQALKNYRHRLFRFAWLSVGSSLVFSISLLFFFATVIDFTSKHYYLLAGILVTFMIVLMISYRIWQKRINRLTQTISDF